jgi:hypothetical protein
MLFRSIINAVGKGRIPSNSGEDKIDDTVKNNDLLV